MTISDTIRRLRPFAVAGLITTSGCAVMEDLWEPDTDLRLRQEQQIAYEQTRISRESSTKTEQELAALRTDLLTLQDNQRQLLNRITDLTEESESRAAQIKELRSLVAAMDTRMQTADATWQDRMAKLKSSLEADQQASMQEMANRMSKELAAISSKLQKSQQATEAGLQGMYTVQGGDTLSAIAQAFSVSVSSVKSANGLKNDIIRPGQQLKIPGR